MSSIDWDRSYYKQQLRAEEEYRRQSMHQQYLSQQIGAANVVNSPYYPGSLGNDILPIKQKQQTEAQATARKTKLLLLED